MESKEPLYTVEPGYRGVQYGERTKHVFIPPAMPSTASNEILAVREPRIIQESQIFATTTPS